MRGGASLSSPGAIISQPAIPVHVTPLLAHADLAQGDVGADAFFSLSVLALLRHLGVVRDRCNSDNQAVMQHPSSISLLCAGGSLNPASRCGCLAGQPGRA